MNRGILRSIDPLAVSHARPRLLTIESLCHGARSQPSSSSRSHDWGAPAEAGCAPATQMLVSGSHPAMTDAVSLATSIARPAHSRYTLTGRWIASHSRATRAQSGMTHAPSRPVVRNQSWRREAVTVSGNSRQSWAQSSAEARLYDLSVAADRDDNGVVPILRVLDETQAGWDPPEGLRSIYRDRPPLATPVGVRIAWTFAFSTRFGRSGFLRPSSQRDRRLRDGLAPGRLPPDKPLISRERL